MKKRSWQRLRGWLAGVVAIVHLPLPFATHPSPPARHDGWHGLGRLVGAQWRPCLLTAYHLSPARAFHGLPMASGPKIISKVDTRAAAQRP